MSGNMKNQDKILEHRRELLSHLITETRFHNKNSVEPVSLATLIWNLFYGKHKFSYTDLEWLIENFNNGK